MQQLHGDLTGSGELVGAEGLACLARRAWCAPANPFTRTRSVRA
jgi:hypothetical protein